jgi:RNA-directed DNA polymerase
LLAKQDLLNEIKRISDKYSFHIYNRLFSIQSIRSKKSRLTSGLDKFVLENDEDCLDLLNQTRYSHFRNINKYKTAIKRNKANSNKKNIIDRVLQKMLLLIIEPYYECTFHEDMYGFRKGRSTIHSIAQVYKYLSQGIENKTIINLDIKGCFDNISIEAMKKI